MKTNYSIVMVDDDPDDHYLFQEALKKINTSCVLTSVFSGTELLNLLQKKESDSQNDLKPDVVIMDLNMPGLSGLATLEKMKSHVDLRRVPVHILSTSRDTKQINNAMDLGANGFHTKPTNHQELQRIIAEILIEL